MSRHDPNRYFFIIAIIFIAAMSGFLWWLHFNVLYSYLIGISVITLLFYGYDKRQAIMNNTRIPELVLHILALMGGTPGAFLGELFFRHKTKKPRFRIVFLMIVLVQAVLGFYCRRYWTEPS
jgi:uncharacterized membrane protein YsdA (DUF1294 family)